MDLNGGTVTCTASIQWNGDCGLTGRKLNIRNAVLQLVRERNDNFIEISSNHKPFKLNLKNVTVHKNFINEGKASVNFLTEKCILFISNAPPFNLKIFIRSIIGVLSGKVTKEKLNSVTKGKVGLTEESNNAKSLQVKKRKFNENENAPSAKRLHTSDNLSEENFKLSDEQNEILQACVSGKSIFFTGSAGTGKSFLLRKILSILPPDGTVPTASTGVAACLIGGVTIHSFAGIGSGDAGLSKCLEMASRSTNAQNWRKCKRLIIDEISMLNGEYFEKIEMVARHVRKTDRPFGGIQLIICGDFFQLPPVVKNKEKVFCFQTEAWEKCIQRVFELQKVHRQNDPEFIKILNYIRIGHISDDISNRLLSTSTQKIECNGILATQLCSRNADAQDINQMKLDMLKGDKVEYKAEDSDPSYTKQLDTQVQASSNLTLKVGAQVMLLKNINVSKGLVNGARGIVIHFKDNLPVVRFKNNLEYICKPEKWIIKTPGNVTIQRKQIPLKLAWAFSIHKSQGLTLDCAEISLSKVFEPGQAYVALSRAKSLDSIRILDFNIKQVWANPEVLRYYKLLRRQLHELTLIPLGSKTNMKENKKNSIMKKPILEIK